MRGRGSLWAVILAGTLAFALTACGGGNKSAGGSGAVNQLPGAKVFASSGCSGCHTLAAASAKGTVGPNLDQLKPDAEKVSRQVRNGGVGMPSFSKKLSSSQIQQVADYVSQATRTATGGGSVAAGFKPDNTKLSDCTADFRCFEQAFANISYKDGPKAALDLFDQKIKTPGPIESDCHRIAHAIGGGALSHYKGNVGQAFVAGRPSCTSGYYHGILERAFLGIHEKDLGAASRRFCSGPQVRSSEFIAYQCVHGLGHGLMIYTGYDLPLSLHTCDKLSTQWDAISCTGGVFMENYQSSYGTVSKWLKGNDLLYPCDAVGKRYKYYCYDMVTARILPKVGYNWATASKVCRRSEKGWVDICFQSLGRDASGFTRLNPKEILKICQNPNAGKMATECVYSAAKDMTYTDVSPRRAKGLCNTAPVSMRGYCWEGIGNILGSFNADGNKRKASCNDATVIKAHRISCYRGAHVTGYE
jgi:mono/diheme cytochrome c family protein